MQVHNWLQLLVQQIKETGWLEWLAVATAVAEVLLAKGNNMLLYPAGIISTAIYIYIMAHVGLYADATLNVYYLVMSIYGWAHWLRRRHEPPLPVTHANRKDWLVTIGIVAVAWGALYIVLKNYTPSTVPVWDGWVAATAWAGMWLLARRKVENWLLLNVSNLFAIPLLFYKELPLTAALTLFLFIVAIFGYLEWKKIYRIQHAA